MIPESEWVWKGLPGHFICCYQCCFRLHTEVGEYRVSTVGCYHPHGDKSGIPHEIGSGRLYETMVFRLDDPGPSQELDGEGYNTEADAQRGHLATCKRWASKVAVGSEAA